MDTGMGSSDILPQFINPLSFPQTYGIAIILSGQLCQTVMPMYKKAITRQI